MSKYVLLISIGLFFLSGCTKMIRVDADTYMQNQEFYEGKNINSMKRSQTKLEPEPQLDLKDFANGHFLRQTLN